MRPPFLRKMQERQRSDRELERSLNLRKNDPYTEAAGGRRYSPADIEALEEERVPWLKEARRRARSRSTT